MPAVSVVIPLYQTERYIGETLRSVLAQTFRDFEVVVIDDGSRDRGPEIARSFNDPRVRVITQENRGLAGARNAGICHARAPLIALLDADDLWAPTKLEKHVAHLAAHPTIGISFSNSALIDEAGKPLGLIQAPAGRPIDAAEILCSNPIGNGSSPVIRRAVFDAIAFDDPRYSRTCWFDESFRQSEDVECWARMATKTNWTFAGIPEALTFYRLNATGLSSNVEKQLGTWLAFRAKLKTIAPALEASTGNRAEAYQRRYLARRAVRSGEGRTAVRMIWSALKLHPRLLREEPLRTSVTTIAAVASSLLPRSLYEQCQKRAVAMMTAVPGLRV